MKILTKISILSAVFAIASSAAFATINKNKLVVIRHGEADHNVSVTFNSNPDHPRYTVAHLTEKGSIQVSETAKRLKEQGYNSKNIAAVYVSPMPRTIETANILAVNGVFSPDQVIIDKRLIEKNAGDREGMKISSFSRDQWKHNPAQSSRFNGESNIDLSNRVVNLYTEVAKKYKDGHVIFVTHGSPAMELVRWVTTEEARLGTAEVAVLELSEDRNVG